MSQRKNGTLVSYNILVGQNMQRDHQGAIGLWCLENHRSYMVAGAKAGYLLYFTKSFSDNSQKVGAILLVVQYPGTNLPVPRKKHNMHQNVYSLFKEGLCVLEEERNKYLLTLHNEW